MILDILMLLSLFACAAFSGISDNVLASCASSVAANSHPLQCIPLQSNKTGLVIPAVCLAYWPASKCYVYTNQSIASTLRQEFTELLDSPLLAASSQSCTDALLTYLCHYFFEGCDLARGVPRPVCSTGCVDLVYASDCLGVFHNVKLLGPPTLAMVSFDCIITGFSETNSTTALDCVDTSDILAAMTAPSSAPGAMTTWMAIIAAMIGLMLVCVVGFCIVLVLYASKLSHRGHQTIIAPGESTAPPLEGLRGYQIHPHSSSMEMLPHLAENGDNYRTMDIQSLTKLGGEEEDEEEEEEEEDSGVVSSGIKQLQRALSVISLEESSEPFEQESVADFQLSSEDADMLYVRLSNVMLPFQDVRIIEKIGEGAFGHVYRGIYSVRSLSPVKEGSKRDIPVAIKTIKCWVSYAELKEFLLESALMSTFRHPNVIELLGICWDSKQRSPYIVLPYMENGDLRNFLRRHRGTATMSSDTTYPKGLEHTELTLMCFQIASGMEYIASMKLVHRDLAARNCMVDGNMVVKVADFGLTRDIYGTDYYRMHNRGRFPVKWMAPESLHDRISNEKTDVWSFGVTCWEVYSLGRSPYPAVSNHEILDYLEQGNRLKKPSLCSSIVYDIMLGCWQRDSQLRYSFSRLASQFGALLRQEGVTVETETTKQLHANSEDQGAIRSATEVTRAQTSPVRRPSYLGRSFSLKTPTKATQLEPAPEPIQPLTDDIMEQLERASPLAFRSLKASSSSIGSSCPDITLKGPMVTTTSKSSSEDEYTVMYAAPPTRSASLLQLVGKAEDRGPHAINRGRRASLQLHKIWTPIEEHDEVSVEYN